MRKLNFENKNIHALRNENMEWSSDDYLTKFIQPESELS